ncbi:MAG: protein-methionine-sulfoxide reductase catalytic subunit MsrP [Gammaproteobacteria bacterium]|uniref:Protein-methionine-sulfoxide reductase catalytic subunit MsrP n=1 Tax=OM182 bacterium TaxID=2510334 RepID=A0A520RXF8_9GAMM|nr:protein-methionine-sulfoxide reductase catalytic subunit MsrP [Gammaproteobacteria bacterium]OUV66935.1 MAG: mononuclear molybdenum enzyme YedY [Gammaproteobacteria bacterium TMED133]RZO74871.1 MAG: protein-methionine-sulfoxide reductase catalytic subunit MsrP [OM182 bacterium]
MSRKETLGKDIKSHEITDESLYLKRRDFMKAMGLGLGILPQFSKSNTDLQSGSHILTHNHQINNEAPGWVKQKISAAHPGLYSTIETPTPYEYVSTYNNFYEFGSGKDDPVANAQNLRIDPWSVEIAGDAEITGTFTLEDVVAPHDLEERIYRLRCVEAWSMVVPWIGFPLKKLLSRFKPLSTAKYVRFETLYDPSQMPGQRSLFKSIDYPYVEGLRIDEATNDLVILAVGLYGKYLPGQNGAPLRLIVPWKYGFKSIKSIVKIEFTSKRPKTTWEVSNPKEYGFYANVNPNVDHPRWSQATERRLPGGLFRSSQIDTKMFNGYAEQVAYLYKGMDLKRFF